MLFTRPFAILHSPKSFFSLALAALFLGLWAVPASAQALIPLKTPVKLPLAQLSTTQGEETTLEKVMMEKGKDRYYLVHLWAPSCPACVPEMKQLDKLQAGLSKQGFTFLFVAQDPNGNFTVPAFSRRHDIATIDSYVDKHTQILKQLRPAGLPSTYLATPDGWIIAYHEGSLDWANPATFGAGTNVN